MRRQRETLVVVEMSPCHIFHSQTAQYRTNTILIQYKYNINPTLIQYKYYANTIIICFKYYTNTTEKCHHVTYSIHRRRPRGPEEPAFIAASEEAPEYSVSLDPPLQYFNPLKY